MSHSLKRISLAVTAGLLLGPAASVLPAVPASAVVSAPTLVSPVAGAHRGANLVLTWNPVAGATSYRVDVSPFADFHGTPSYTMTTVNRQATPTTDLASGLYYWRVSAFDAANTAYPSAPETFVKDALSAPAGLSPDGGAVRNYPVQPPVLSWGQVTGAKSYNVDVDDDNGFASPQSYSTTNLSLVPAAPQAPADNPFYYYWRVQAVSAGGVQSDWSPSATYGVSWSAVPTLLGPPNDPGNVNVIDETQFQWTPVIGAATYALQVSPDGNWANNLTVDIITKSTAYTPPVALPNASYFWRVRALDTAVVPNAGAWSATWAFSKGPTGSDIPALLTPVFGATVTTLDFSWSPVRHASHYEFQMGTDPNFSPGNTPDVCITNHTHFTPYLVPSPQPPSIPSSFVQPSGCNVSSSRPLYGTTYYWRVRGVDDAPGTSTVVVGIWSAASRFQLNTPNVATPVSPAPPGSTPGVTVPALAWQPVAQAASYKVTIVRADTTTEPSYPVTTNAPSYTPTSASLSLAPADGPFTWYVQSIDSLGRVGPVPPSNTFGSFNLLAPPATVNTVPSLTGPADATSATTSPAMSWLPVNGATYYQVWYANAGTPFDTMLANSLPYPAYSHPASLPAGDYYWYAKAFNASNVMLGSSAASTRTFSVGSPSVIDDSSLTSPHYLTPANDATLYDTPVLSWESVPGAASYVVYLATDPNFTGNLKSRTTQYTSLTLTESLLDNQAASAYYWFVQPCVGYATSCGRFDSGVYGTGRSFHKQSAPVSMSFVPGGGGYPVASGAATSEVQVTLHWDDYLSSQPAGSTQEARQYHVELSTSPGFGQLLDSATVDGTSYTLYSSNTKPYPDGQIYWRVQAVDGTSNPLTYTTGGLTTDSTEPVLDPVVPATTGVPNLSWTPATECTFDSGSHTYSGDCWGAYNTGYDLEVYNDPDLAPAHRVLLPPVIKTPAYTPLTALPPGNYSWRVRRVFDTVNTIKGAWSLPGTFTVAKSAPVLVSPANNQAFTSRDMLFTWTAVPGAAQYQFISVASSSSTYETVTTVSNSWAPPLQSPSYTDGVYTWHVSALDAAGNVIDTSSTRSFRKDLTAPTAALSTPTSGVAITAPIAVQFSEPVQGVSASSVSVVVAGTSTVVAGTVTPSSGTTSTASWAPSAPLVPGQSYALRLTGAVHDLVGNALVPITFTTRTATSIDSTSPAVVESWDRDTASGASASGYAASASGGATLTYSVTGTSVSFLTHRDKLGGYAEIYLDGVKQPAKLSFYSAVTHEQVTLFSKAGLSNATHKVMLKVLGTHPSGSTGNWVYADVLKAGSTRYEETGARMTWRRLGMSSATGGSYDTESHTLSGDTGSQPFCSATFKGTAVSVRAVAGPVQGTAKVYVDGVLKQTVDLYSSSAYVTAAANVSGLSNAVHTVKVILTGSKSTASKGTWFSLDSFEVS